MYASDTKKQHSEPNLRSCGSVFASDHTDAPKDIVQESNGEFLRIRVEHDPPWQVRIGQDEEQRAYAVTR
ncbi:unnamed protein product, partial [Mesorhabditis spiculigera]